MTLQTLATLPADLGRVALGTLLVVLAMVSVAAGQPTPLTGAARSIVLTELVLPATADPTGSRAAIEPTSSATLVTGAGGTTGKFTFGFKQGDNFVHATLSAPATDGRAALILGDELPSGTKVTVAFTRLIGLSTSLTTTASAPAQALTNPQPPKNRQDSAKAREDTFSVARSGALVTKPGLLVTGSFDYGREKFTYRETDAGPDLEPQLRESAGGSIAVGLLFRPTGSTSATYFGMGYRAGTAWKATATKTRCTAIASSQAMDCAPVVIGGPTKVKKESLSLELRQNIGTFFGWTPLLAYDFEAVEGKRLLFEVPLYLVTDGAEKPQLTGGVALGWREGSGAYAAVFVGPKFSIPGIP